MIPSSAQSVKVVVGKECHDPVGVIGARGFYVDAPPVGRQMCKAEREHNHTVNDAVAEIAEHRSAIDEIKGMLMLVYHIDDRNAFDVLRRRSQATNTKLRLLARQLLIDVASMSCDENVPLRTTFDALLLTAHERCAHDSEAGDVGSAERRPSMDRGQCAVQGALRA